MRTSFSGSAGWSLNPVELRRVQNQIESSFVWGLEELLSRAERLQYWNHYAGDPGFTPRYIETVRTRTAAGILEVARAVLGRPRVEVVTRPGASS